MAKKEKKKKPPAEEEKKPVEAVEKPAEAPEKPGEAPAEAPKEELKKKKKPEKEKPKKEERKPAKGVKQIIRIADKDLDGAHSLPRALTHIKGVSFSMANAISKKAAEELGISPSVRLGSLNEEQVKALADIVINPAKHGIPPYLLNRRKDRESGKNIHLTGHEMSFKTQEDVGMEKKVRSYKGVRHQAGLTVRGQRTRTSGRKGRTVGVQKTARMKKAQKR